jgi:hypothetical protein
MNKDFFVLDDGETPIKIKLAPAIVSFEWIFFAVLMSIQYFFLAIIWIYSAVGLVNFLWFFVIVLQILLSGWQTLSSILVWASLKDKPRFIHISATVLSVVGLLIFGKIPAFIIMVIWGWLIIPQILSWFYLIICYRDSQTRKKEAAPTGFH